MLQSFFGWTVETVVTGFIPPVHLVTIATHTSILYELCVVFFLRFLHHVFSNSKCCQVLKCNLFVSGDNGEILHIIANVYTSNLNHSNCTEGGADQSRLTQLHGQGWDFP